MVEGEGGGKGGGIQDHQEGGGEEQPLPGLAIRCGFGVPSHGDSPFGHGPASILSLNFAPIRGLRVYLAPVKACVPQVACADRSFAVSQDRWMGGGALRTALLGSSSRLYLHPVPYVPNANAASSSSSTAAASDVGDSGGGGNGDGGEEKESLPMGVQRGVQRSVQKGVERTTTRRSQAARGSVYHRSEHHRLRSIVEGRSHGRVGLEGSVSGSAAVLDRDVWRCYASSLRSGLQSPLLQMFGTSSVRLPGVARLVADCGKMRALDMLLKRLKEGGHRCLIFTQMTKMLDILEDYMVLRQLTYLRLDGSSNIEDRRDMVSDYQSDASIFCFLLSTRAGGLGINLTAADTVIFYDTDWNPTMDAQAMDRCHRIGQTKQVTVYVTKPSLYTRYTPL